MRKPLGFAAAAAVFAGCFLFSAGKAHAQYGDPAPPPATGYYNPPPQGPPPQEYPGGFPLRLGFTLGGGLGFGDMSCDCVAEDDPSNHRASGSGHIHGGVMLNPRLAILGDIWVLAHVAQRTFYGDLVLSHNMFTIDARYWLSPMFWLQGGLGWAWLRWSYEDASYSETYAETEASPALVVAAGYEVLHAPRFAIDIDLRIGAGFYDEPTDPDGSVTVTNVALGASVNWY